MPIWLTGPLLKLLGVLALILALIGVGEWHGRGAVQTKWDASIAKQAVASANTVIKAAENTAKLETKLETAKRTRAGTVQIIHDEVIRYAEGPSQKCVLNSELERVADDLARLHNDADRVPAAPSAPGQPAAAPETHVTDVALLRAYEDATAQLFTFWDTYHALVEWVTTTYVIEREGAGR